MPEPPRTPGRDGEVLLVPGSAELGELLRTARERFARMDFTVAGVEAAGLRGQARAELAGRLGADLPGPWMVTGHQPEMHHAGVWFKDAVIAALSEAAGGTALHLVADLDHLREAELAVPSAGPDGHPAVRRVPFAHASKGACPAAIDPPSAEMLDALIAAVERDVPRADLFGVWAGQARAVRSSAGTLGKWLSRARAAVEAELLAASNAEPGTPTRDVLLSDLVAGEAFTRFAADLVVRHREMHALHGQVLAEHRRRHRIRNRSAVSSRSNRARPVPDLGELAGALEVPLWAFRPGEGGRPYRGRQGRERLFARAEGGRIELLTPTGPLGSVPDDPGGAFAALRELAGRGVRLAPRALTLTMFARSFLADLFVHGLGGANYDACGDELTERWYQWRPPPFVVATATARMDLPRQAATAAQFARARWNCHHAWHNPQLYAAGPTAPEVADLLAEKARALAELEEAPRRSRRRAEAFAAVQQANDRLRARLGEAIWAVRADARRLEEQLARNAVADSREYFFALLPRAKLLALAEQARAWASGLRAAGAS